MTRATLAKVVELESEKLLICAKGDDMLDAFALESLEVLARVVKLLGPDPIPEPETDAESTLEADLDTVAGG